MNVLASLARAYEGMQSAAPYGYSAEKIGYEIALYADGSLARPPIDRRAGDGKRKIPKLMVVPQPRKRTSGIVPNFLWDKTSYVLGVTAGETTRTTKEHAAFVAWHSRALQSTEDEGLRALLRFLESWNSNDFYRFGWPAEMRDQNVVFSLESDRLKDIRVHDRPAARALWAQLNAKNDAPISLCLVSGERAPLARLHPPIKGVWGAQPAGASIVSFNLDAFASYGHEQGENAPVSEAAAFAYTTALNRFLEKGSGQSVHVGDASTVFWADASDPATGAEAERFFLALLGGAKLDETSEGKKLAAIFAAIYRGEHFEFQTLNLPPSVRFFVLALAPNVARLSIRFFIEDDFREITKRYFDHVERMRIEPPPLEQTFTIWRLLLETAAQRKSSNIPPQLAGDWLRAILTGAPYPLTLLLTILTRIGVDHDVNALRVGVIRAILLRNFDSKEKAPMALDPDNDDPGYLLGRLFAILETIQRLSYGGGNAGIKESYYRAASVMPRRVFPLLLRLNVYHQNRTKGEAKGLVSYYMKQLSEVMNKLPSEFPASLNIERQGTFALGYFHQKNYRKTTDNSDTDTKAGRLS